MNCSKNLKDAYRYVTHETEQSEIKLDKNVSNMKAKEQSYKLTHLNKTPRAGLQDTPQMLSQWLQFHHGKKRKNSNETAFPTGQHEQSLRLKKKSGGHL